MDNKRPQENDQRNEKTKMHRVEYIFPTQKLKTKSTTNLPKCVLLLAGSFSPVTNMHLRLLGKRDFFFN